VHFSQLAYCSSDFVTKAWKCGPLVPGDANGRL
jgi:hypothetical protein